MRRNVLGRIDAYLRQFVIWLLSDWHSNYWA